MLEVSPYALRLFGVIAMALFALAGLAVVLRPEHKIKAPGHRLGNLIIWVLGEQWGMRLIRLSGWAMVIGGGFGFIAALIALGRGD